MLQSILANQKFEIMSQVESGTYTLKKAMNIWKVNIGFGIDWQMDQGYKQTTITNFVNVI